MPTFIATWTMHAFQWVKRPAVKDPGIRTKRFDRRKAKPSVKGKIQRIAFRQVQSPSTASRSAAVVFPFPV